MIFSSILFSQNPLLTNDVENQKKWVDSTYNSLSIDQKIGQLFTIWVATKCRPFPNSDVPRKLNRISLFIGVVS